MIDNCASIGGCGVVGVLGGGGGVTLAGVLRTPPPPPQAVKARASNAGAAHPILPNFSIIMSCVPALSSPRLSRGILHPCMEASQTPFAAAQHSPHNSLASLHQRGSAHSSRRCLMAARLNSNTQQSVEPEPLRGSAHHSASRSSQMSDIVIAAAKRTPIGAFLGQFTGFATPRLGAAAISAALQQSGIAPGDVGEVLMGCVLPANLGQAPARQAALAAGLPPSTGCTTLNKVCGSGMKAIMLGHDLIKAGSASIVVAGGMESMTNAPHMAAVRTGIRYGDAAMVDHMAWDGLTNPYDGKSMGVFAEACADKYHFTREAQDAFATESVRRAQEAVKSGAFADEIATVTVPGRKGDVAVSVDETPGKVDPAKIPTLKPAFRKENGTVTAASSSSISDGAAAVVLLSADDAKARGVQPLA